MLANNGHYSKLLWAFALQGAGRVICCFWELVLVGDCQLLRAARMASLANRITSAAGLIEYRGCWCCGQRILLVGCSEKRCFSRSLVVVIAVGVQKALVEMSKSTQ